MNISVKSEYALLAILDLAMQTPGEPVKIADIARRQKIPQKFLELILASLKHGGFVESRRGAEGGYRLAKPGLFRKGPHRRLDDLGRRAPRRAQARQGNHRANERQYRNRARFRGRGARV